MKIGKKFYIVVLSGLVFVTGIALYFEQGLGYPNKHGNTVSGDAPNYPVNEQGQTYSSGPFPAGGQGPDLIKATGEDGVDGYVKSSDLIPQVSSPEEAIAYMESIENVDYIPIPLYKSDGKTVIGEFRLGN